MPLTVSFDSVMEDELRSLAEKSGMTAEEYVVMVVSEAVEDARDYEECVAIMEEYERNKVSYSHEEVMREFGIHRTDGR